MDLIKQTDLISAIFGLTTSLFLMSLAIYLVSTSKPRLLKKNDYILNISAVLIAFYVSFIFDVWDSVIIIAANTTGLIIFLYIYTLTIDATSKESKQKLNIKNGMQIFLILKNYSKNIKLQFEEIGNKKIIYATISIFAVVAIFALLENQEPSETIFPVYEYPHDERSGSITGGFVYRGDNLTGLYGKYIYGDFAKSEIRALDINGRETMDTLLISSRNNVSFVTGGNEYIRPASFGTDRDNNIYMVDHNGYLFKINETENGTIYLKNLFPNHLFKNPVGISQLNHEKNSFLIIEKEGKILKADFKTKNVTILYDLSEKIMTKDWEQGLLGIAINPNVENNSEIFITYTSIVGGNLHLSKLLSENGSYHEENLMIINKEKDIHNGGHISFGPDGYLYLGIGDDNNPKNANNLGNLKGKILRIDTQNKEVGKGYSIPDDNPYYKNDQGWSEEIYAYGFRNPWKFTFDEETGELWLGDVGQKDWEEINNVISGGNYGWPYFEGKHCYSEFSQCKDNNWTLFYASLIVSISFLSFYFSSINLVPLKNANNKRGLLFLIIGISMALLWYYQTYVTSTWRSIDMMLNLTTLMGFFCGIIIILVKIIYNLKPKKSQS